MTIVGLLVVKCLAYCLAHVIYSIYGSYFYFEGNIRNNEAKKKITVIM